MKRILNEKICSLCKVSQSIDNFHKTKRNTDGLKSFCKKCISIQNAEYRRKNRDRISAKKKEYWNKNKDTINKKRAEDRKDPTVALKKKESDRKYYLANRDKLIEKNSAYKKNNRELYNKYAKEKSSTPEGKIYNALRTTTQRMSKKIKQKKDFQTMKVVNYTLSEYKEHIENLFSNGMTWENHGTLWEVDHKVPLSIIIENNKGKSLKELHLIANDLSNIQPMLSSENRSKQARWIG